MPEAIIGHYAIHLRLVEGRPWGPGWTVTHRATGRSVWRTRDFIDSVRVAEALVAQALIPEEKDACLQWRANLTPSARSLLIEQLSMIAPRDET